MLTFAYASALRPNSVPNSACSTVALSSSRGYFVSATNVALGTKKISEKALWERLKPLACALRSQHGLLTRRAETRNEPRYSLSMYILTGLG